MKRRRTNGKDNLGIGYFQGHPHSSTLLEVPVVAVAVVVGGGGGVVVKTVWH